MKRAWHWFSVQGQYNQLPWCSFLLMCIFAPLATAFRFYVDSELALFSLSLGALCAASTVLRKCIRHLVHWIEFSPISFVSAHTLGGLVDFVFSPTPELIFAVVAIIKHETIIAQTAIIGAILCNLLLVLGSCLLIGSHATKGGAFRDFPHLLARTNCQLLMTGIGSLVIPAAYNTWSESSSQHIPSFSRALAVVLLMLYGCIFWFFYDPRGPHDRRGATTAVMVVGGVLAAPATNVVSSSLAEQLKVELRRHLRAMKLRQRPVTVLTGAGIAAVVTVFMTEFVVEASGAATDSLGMSKSFIGLVVVPFLLQLSDHVVGAMHASNQEISWIIHAVMAACCQQYFYVLPVAVITSWIIGDDQMTFRFDGLQMVIFVFVVVVINFMMQKALLHWLDGILLMALYSFFVIPVFFYPNDA